MKIGHLPCSPTGFGSYPLSFNLMKIKVGFSVLALNFEGRHQNCLVAIVRPGKKISYYTNLNLLRNIRFNFSHVHKER